MKVTAADLHTLFLMEDAQVYSCGDNAHCQLGDLKSLTLHPNNPQLSLVEFPFAAWLAQLRTRLALLNANPANIIIRARQAKMPANIAKRTASLRG